MKTFINAVVRIEQGKPIIFWHEYKQINCFTFADGHNVASREYMHSLKLAPDDIAKSFIDQYNHCYYEGMGYDTPLKLCKRLKY